MKNQDEAPVIFKSEYFVAPDNIEISYTIGYGSTAIENLSLKQLKQVKRTLDFFLKKEKS